MINMLRSDMYKMFRAVSFRVLLITAAVICVFSVFFVNFSVKTTLEYQEQKRIEAESGETVPKDPVAAAAEDSFMEGMRLGFQSGMEASISASEQQTGQDFLEMEFDYPTVFEGMLDPLYGNSLITMLTAIFTSIFISGEFIHGTIKNSAARGVSRIQLYFSKLLTCMAFAVIILAAEMLAMLLTELIIWEPGALDTDKMVKSIIGLLLGMFPYMAFISIFTAIAFCVRSGGATAVNIIIVMFGGLLFQMASSASSLDMTFAWPGTAMNLTAKYYDNTWLAAAAVIASIAYMVLSSLIGITVFSRKDI